jgi:hypothetical protein
MLALPSLPVGSALRVRMRRWLGQFVGNTLVGGLKRLVRIKAPIVSNASMIIYGRRGFQLQRRLFQMMQKFSFFHPSSVLLSAMPFSSMSVFLLFLLVFVVYRRRYYHLQPPAVELQPQRHCAGAATTCGSAVSCCSWRVFCLRFLSSDDGSGRGRMSQSGRRIDDCCARR